SRGRGVPVRRGWWNMLRADLDRFEATRARTLDLVRDLSQPELDAVPAPGRWSVGEVLDHLLLAERFFRDEMRQLIALARAGRRRGLRRSLADLDISIGSIPKAWLPFLELPFRLTNPFVPGFIRDFALRSRLVPAQHPTRATPRPGRPGGALRQELADSVRETRALFEANADLDYRRLLHVHPLLGTNDVPGLLHIVTL